MDHFSVSSGVGISYEKIKPLNIAIKAIIPELHKLMLLAAWLKKQEE